MRIAVLADGIPPAVIGGMQKHSYFICKYLALHGVTIELHTMVWNHEDLQIPLPFSNNDLSRIKVVSHVFPKTSWFPGHYVYNSYRLSKLIYNSIQARLHEFDFIYSKGYTGWELLRKGRNNQGPKVGVKFHGMNMFLPTRGWKQRLEQIILRPPTKWIMKKADVVFSYGGRVTDVILQTGIGGNKILEVHTGIELNWIRDEIRRTTTNRRVIFIGRNDPVKGVRELNQVLASGKFSNVGFDIVGPFSMADRIEASNVLYHGSISEQWKLIELFDQADALILPSYSEGMPNVILEAMARGLVILATNVGAIDSMVDSNGWLIERSSSEQVSNLILRFKESTSDDIDEMKRRSLEKVKNEFLWTNIASHLVKEIEELLKR